VFYEWSANILACESLKKLEISFSFKILRKRNGKQGCLRSNQSLFSYNNFGQDEQIEGRNVTAKKEK
jgi:hypothetical protein